jgi:hypothetical protein
MQPEGVFTPNSPPKVTYIDRTSHGKRLEETLTEGLKTKGLLVSISGASKSGKTVLVERVAGEYLIGVSGAGIRSSDDLWNRALAWLGTPVPASTTLASGNTGKVSVSGEAGGGLLGLVQAKAGGSLATERTQTTSVSTSVAVDHVEQIRKELANSGFVLFIDDFHYIDREA